MLFRHSSVTNELSNDFLCDRTGSDSDSGSGSGSGSDSSSSSAEEEAENSEESVSDYEPSHKVKSRKPPNKYGNTSLLLKAEYVEASSCFLQRITNISDF